MKYKVCFSGFAYVEAENEENAQEIYEDGGFCLCAFCKR